MKKIILKLLCLTAAVIIFTSCGPKIYISTSAYRQLETEVIKNDLDGHLTLKVYGNGINEDDAIDQAMRNAVNEVTFKGIVNGNGTRNVPPIFSNPNVKLDNQNYFDDFFLRDYRKYVQVVQKVKKMKGFGSSERVNLGVILEVDMNRLRRHYQNDGLLK